MLCALKTGYETCPYIQFEIIKLSWRRRKKRSPFYARRKSVTNCERLMSMEKIHTATTYQTVGVCEHQITRAAKTV